MDRGMTQKPSLIALRRTFLCVLGFVWGVGTIFYASKWGFRFDLEQDGSFIREKFGFAENKAPVEQIDWKARYYTRVDRIKQLSMELMHVKESIQNEKDEGRNMDIESKLLQEENLMMMAQIDYLEEQLKKENLAMACINSTESRNNNTTTDHKGPATMKRSNHSRVAWVDSKKIKKIMANG